jgi:hypothetical protein
MTWSVHLRPSERGPIEMLTTNQGMPSEQTRDGGSDAKTPTAMNLKLV